MTNQPLTKQRAPDVELVKEFKDFLEVRPIPNRYVLISRLALKKYQEEYGAKTFAEINLARFFKYRNVGPKTICFLWELYGKPEAWNDFIRMLK